VGQISLGARHKVTGEQETKAWVIQTFSDDERKEK
jgi:hypothetical protein